MARIALYQLDAFASEPFRGNPAAVCPLESFPEDSAMQSIAAENNLSETAFFVPAGPGRYRLRWFTPTVEVALCGHATLASAWVVFERLAPRLTSVAFETRSGTLTVARGADELVMDFPALPASPVADPPEALAAGLRACPSEVLRATNYLAVFETEDAVRALSPDFARLATLHPYGVIATAPGTDRDFVSRYFGPSFGVPEDPATGSAHCTLAPYWAKRLGKARLAARQVSKRGAELMVEHRGDRVAIAGQCVLFMEGEIVLS
jgi:PhzF family phenazine biosynthesis protein